MGGSRFEVGPPDDDDDAAYDGIPDEFPASIPEDRVRDLYAEQSRQRYEAFRRNSPATRVNIGTRKTLLGLQWDGGRWVGRSDRLFRAEGLLVTNAPPGARLALWRVGMENVLPVGDSPIALDVFSLLEQLGTCERCGHSLSKSPRPTFPTLGLGMSMTLLTTDAAGGLLGPTGSVDAIITGSPMSLTVWGQTPLDI